MRYARKPSKEQAAARLSGVSRDIDAECLGGFRLMAGPMRLDVSVEVISGHGGSTV